MELNTWPYSLALVLLTLVILFIKLLPIDPTSNNWIAPDLFLCFVFLLSYRLPKAVPMLLIAFLALLQDFLLQRAIGFNASLILLSSEYIKFRAYKIERYSFRDEWITVSIAFTMIFLLSVLAERIVIIEISSIRLLIMELFANICFFPIIAMIGYLIIKTKYLKAVDFSRKSGGYF